MLWQCCNVWFHRQVGPAMECSVKAHATLVPETIAQTDRDARMD